MKHFDRTLQDLWFKSDLSETKATTACAAAEWHQTTAHAKQAVAAHRAQSKDIRAALKNLLDKLDSADRAVEEAFKATMPRGKYLCGEILLGNRKFRVVIDMALKKLLQVEWWYGGYTSYPDAGRSAIESQIIVNGQVKVSPTGDGLALSSTIPDWAVK